MAVKHFVPRISSSSEPKQSKNVVKSYDISVIDRVERLKASVKKLSTSTIMQVAIQ